MAITIHIPKADDSFVIAEVKSQAWRAFFRAFIPKQILDKATPEEVHHHWLGVPEDRLPDCGLLLKNHDGVIGYAVFGATKAEGYGYSGQLHEIYLRPSVTRRGYGRALFAAAHDQLLQAGHERMMLWTFAANDGARRFYESSGGARIAGASKLTEIGGARLREIAYGFRHAGHKQHCLQNNQSASHLQPHRPGL